MDQGQSKLAKPYYVTGAIALRLCTVERAAVQGGGRAAKSYQGGIWAHGNGSHVEAVLAREPSESAISLKTA
jgi:hypothetical protein